MMRAPMAGTAIYFYWHYCCRAYLWVNGKVNLCSTRCCHVEWYTLHCNENTNAQYVDFLLEKFEIVSERIVHLWKTVIS